MDQTITQHFDLSEMEWYFWIKSIFCYMTNFCLASLVRKSHAPKQIGSWRTHPQWNLLVRRITRYHLFLTAFALSLFSWAIHFMLTYAGGSKGLGQGVWGNCNLAVYNVWVVLASLGVAGGMWPKPNLWWKLLLYSKKKSKLYTMVLNLGVSTFNLFLILYL